MNSLIFLNKNIKLIIIKKNKNIVLNFNSKYFYNFFFFYIKKSNILINSNLNFMKLIDMSCKSVFEIKNFINNHNYFFLKKIIFNGKGFKLKKIKNKINFNFNNSHIKLLISNKIKVIKNNKNSFLILLKTSFVKYNKIIDFIVNLFKLNIYTKRGIRQNRKIVLIKKIKKK